MSYTTDITDQLLIVFIHVEVLSYYYMNFEMS